MMEHVNDEFPIYRVIRLLKIYHRRIRFVTTCRHTLLEVVHRQPWVLDVATFDKTGLVRVDESGHERAESVCEHARVDLEIDGDETNRTVVCWVTAVAFFEKQAHDRESLVQMK